MDQKTSFVEIIQQHEGLIYRITRVYAADREDMRDLYQEIVYQLWKSFGSFRNQSKVGTWMYKVALNTSIAHKNNAKRKPGTIPMDDILLNITDQSDTLMDERSELLFTLIKQLNDIDKGIILLYLEDKSYEEIAAITGFTASNVGTRLGRIKQKLTSQIK